MKRYLIIFGVLLAIAGSGPARLDSRVSASSQASADRSVQQAQAQTARPMFQQYCVSCHNDRLKTGDLVLTGIDASDARQHAAVLEKVVRKLRGGTMPPAGSPRPDKATLDAFIASVEGALDRQAAATPNPGRVASRRLNRSEYVNVVRDLLDLEVNGSELLPSDMAGFGFDNNADVLSMTPSLMSRYIAAATKISRLALASPDNRPITQVYRVGFENRSARASDDLPFATRGGIAVRHPFPLDGEYVFKLRLKRNGTVSTIDGIDEDQHEVEIRIDHGLVKRFTIGGEFKGPDPGVLIAVPEDDKYGQKLHDYRMNADDALEVRLPIKAGSRLVAAAFTDAAPTPERIVRSRGRNGPGEVDGNAPGIDVLSISGPFDGKTPEDTPSRRRILICRPTGAPASAQSASARQTGTTARQAREEEDCARKILGTLARHAYRRPVTDEDVQPLVAIYKEGRAARDFEAGIERALEALLSSPSFLFRAEQEGSGTRAGAAYRLSDLELASRLSFFLWRSIPDDELLEAAAAGQLKTPAGVARQVKRMLADKKSSRFMKDFSEQWLEIRNVQSKAPDSNLFSSFDDSLRKAMLKETELFFESQVREDRPVQDLLRADYTFLNEQLARHYGINDVFGGHFRRVTVTDERRRGLLGHASVLTTTSYENRTSVVLRGKWVLENLLGAPPPPPPPNVPPLKENDGRSKPTALRERMEQHRNNPVCASCHSRMDPLGFALEHYDAVGQWRDTDSGAAINASITLHGEAIDSPKAFREALLTQTDEFPHTVAEKLLTYALGRGLDYYDAPAVRELVREMKGAENKWSSLVLGIVQSRPFTMRRAGDPSSSPATTSAAARH